MLTTEKRNPKTTHIDKMSTEEMVRVINEENFRAVRAVSDAGESITRAVDAVSASINSGGRLFYIGAGTSGRLGVLDASECPPTYGVPYGLVTGIIAGGERALTYASEGAEDSGEAGRRDFLSYAPTSRDALVGISAAGGAEYVLYAIRAAKELGCVTVALTCNEGTKLGQLADIEIVTDTGEEVITGSTRMKAGTAQKLVLNTLSTCAMVKAGHVYENLMINLRPSNEKLRRRMIGIVEELAGVSSEEAERRLDASDWVIRKALE